MTIKCHPHSATEGLNPANWFHKDLKYIVFSSEDMPDAMVVFPLYVQHKTFKYLNPVSAGFIKQGKCCGESEGLELASSPEDQDLLDIMIN